MKKFIAFLLLATCLFHIGGQLVLREYLVYQSGKFYDQQTKKGLYNVNDLTEIMIPSEMPNIAEWPGFVNVTGQVQFGNASYNYVKMKMTRHAIYLVCVPNYNSTRLSVQNIISAKGIKDIPVSKKNHVPYAKVVLNDQFHFISSITSLVALKILISNRITKDQQLITNSTEIPEEPPRLTC